jgi:hypothetical protein
VRFDKLSAHHRRQQQNLLKTCALSLSKGALRQAQRITAASSKIC